MRVTLLLPLFLLHAAWAEEPVHFPDPVMKAAVERDLSIADPTPTDMLGLTQFKCVQAFERTEGITDLTGLEYAVNLQSLNLRFNQIRDISVLSGLVYLETLDLSRNWISDLTPLASLSNLRYANLHENLISNIAPLSGLSRLETLILHSNTGIDLTPLAALTGLRELDLGNCNVADLAGLSSLTRLSTLYLWHNQISDLSPLAGLTDLRVLHVGTNRISDLTPLAGLPNLQELDLEGNQVFDVAPLCALRSLTRLNLRNNPLNQEAYDLYLPQIAANNPRVSIEHDAHGEQRLLVSSSRGGYVISPGEGAFTYEHDANVRLEARAHPGFTFGGWSGTFATLQNPAVFTIDQDGWMRAKFVSAQTVLQVDEDAPGDPGPGEPTVSDPNEDGSSAHPLDSIREAIEIAGAGVTIFVRAGTYRENLDSLGKDIQLISVGPNGPGQPPYAVLEAAQPGPVVRFSGRNGQPRLLNGFVVTGGQDRTAGAIFCRDTTLDLVRCLIVGNRSTDPDGAIFRAAASRVTMTNCTIADNHGGLESAAITLVDSDLTMTNSILWNDTQTQVLAGGISKPVIRYCTVRGWWPDIGNLHADPLFARRGDWVNAENADEILNAADTRAVWTTGDYHLQSQAGRWNAEVQAWVRDEVSSPCIDAGDPTSSVNAEPEPNGRRINLGAYGGTAEAAKSYGQAPPP